MNYSINPSKRDLFLREKKQQSYFMMLKVTMKRIYIKNLPDGIRAAKSSNERANFIFCEAGDYQKIFLTDENDNLIKTDIITAINKIKCDREENPLRLPAGFNQSVTKVTKRFRRDVGERKTKRDAMKTLKPQLRSVLW